jgi:hypothetical protein
MHLASHIGRQSSRLYTCGKGAFFMHPTDDPGKSVRQRPMLAVLPNRDSAPFDTFCAIDATEHGKRGSGTILYLI